MSHRTLRRALGPVLACAAISAVAPAIGSASTYTVDDDKAECPNAAFTSIQAAVDQAAPWDTVIVCDGVYEEQSTPSSGSESPSAPGSVNGLTITKPLTIKGAGASKVTIRPASSLTTLAGTVPYLRDGGGNVVTVSKQARDSTDKNTMFVDISGVTITSGDAYAEAGVAFFDASGAIRDSVVGPMKRAADATELADQPHGWGVVVSNHYQGAEAGPRREITIEDSLVTGYQSGGILFDDSFGADGAATTYQRSGIVSYGYVRGTVVQGSGPDALIPQTGIRYHAGARGEVTRSTIAGNYFTPTPRKSVGVLATDAETGPDPSSPSVPGLTVYNNVLKGNGYGLFNADAFDNDVRLGAPLAAATGTLGLENYFGCATGPLVGAPSDSDDPATACQGISGDDAAGDESITLGALRTTAQVFPAVPGATPDAAPTGKIAEPLDGPVIVGKPISAVVQAADDFGVKSVSLAVDGTPLGTLGKAPYTFDWTPTDVGSTHVLTATIVDSSGQSTMVTRTVTVAPESTPDGGGGHGGGGHGDGGHHGPTPPVTGPVAGGPGVVVPGWRTRIVILGRRSVSGKGLIRVGTVYVRDTGGARVKVTGKLTVGKRTFRVTTSTRARTGRGTALVIKLTPAARKALTKRAGTLRVKVTTRSSSTTKAKSATIRIARMKG